MRAHVAVPRLPPGVAADSRGDARSICNGCGEHKPVCPGCAVCRDCRHTDRQHGTRTAPPCIVCDRGEPDIARLPWHSNGVWPLSRRPRGAG